MVSNTLYFSFSLLNLLLVEFVISPLRFFYKGPLINVFTCLFFPYYISGIPANYQTIEKK